MTSPVIVIGGGHNGLTAATVLAKAGRKVILLEAAASLGGLARGEGFHPGFRTAGLLHDASGLRPSIAKALSLKSHGLRFRDEPMVQTVPGDAGIVRLRGPEISGAVSDDDALAYREFMRFLTRLKKPLGRVLSKTPPSPLGNLSALVIPALGIRRLGARDMMELLRVPSMCVADWMRDHFTSEPLSAAIAHGALLGSMAGPWSPWTAANLLFEGAARQRDVLGGPAALVASLERAATAAGVDVRCGARVGRILVGSDGVEGVELEGGEKIEAVFVLSTCDPKTTFLDLVGPRILSNSVLGSIGSIRTRGTTAKLNIALTGSLLDSEGQKVELMRTGASLDDLERAFDAAKYRQMSRRPILDIRVPSDDDPGLAPAGHSVVSILAHYAPYNLEGGWTDEAKAQFQAAALGVLEENCPGTRERIVATQLLSPADIEAEYLVTDGHIYHGEHAPDQLLFMRPTIDMADYRTPIAGLYLGASGCHPGGGITCAPGYLGAKTLVRDA